MDVAFLCEGDPLFYGSFAYLLARLAQNYLTQVVPGINSITACAAAINRPLAARNDILKVLPGTLDASRLKQEIISSDAIAIMKVGQHFDKIRGVLSELDLAGQAIIIERATLDDEKVTPLVDVPEGETSTPVGPRQRDAAAESAEIAEQRQHQRSVQA